MDSKYWCEALEWQVFFPSNCTYLTYIWGFFPVTNVLSITVNSGIPSPAQSPARRDTDFSVSFSAIEVASSSSATSYLLLLHCQILSASTPLPDLICCSNPSSASPPLWSPRGPCPCFGWNTMTFSWRTPSHLPHLITCWEIAWLFPLTPLTCKVALQHWKLKAMESLKDACFLCVHLRFVSFFFFICFIS